MRVLTLLHVASIFTVFNAYAIVGTPTAEILPKPHRGDWSNTEQKVKFGAKSTISSQRRTTTLDYAAHDKHVQQYEIPLVNKVAVTEVSIDLPSRQPRRQRTRVKINDAEAVHLKEGRHRSLARSNTIGSNSNGGVSVTAAPSKQKVTKVIRHRRPIPVTTSTVTPSTTTTSTTTTTTTPRSVYGFTFPTFNFFQQNFWNSWTTPPTTVPTTKRPPKKYTSTTYAPLKEEKLIYNKGRVPVKSTKLPATTTRIFTESGPFRIALPTYANQTQEVRNGKDKEKRSSVAILREKFNCPRESEVRFQLFPKICKIDKDCTVWNRDELCCDIFGAKSCVSGIPKPLEETSHSPILGFIQRKCPSRPLAELWWDVQECETDMDCWPRVCCPDGQRRYCRTSQPELDAAPVPVKRSFDYLSEYLECTAPPPPIFDLHPKVCSSTLDCFPNVCCQESGLRHCRPPKKSVLTLMANVLNVDFVKRLAQNIVIK